MPKNISNKEFVSNFVFPTKFRILNYSERPYSSSTDENIKNVTVRLLGECIRRYFRLNRANSKSILDLAIGLWVGMQTSQQSWEWSNKIRFDETDRLLSIGKKRATLKDNLNLRPKMQPPFSPGMTLCNVSIIPRLVLLFRI